MAPWPTPMSWRTISAGCTRGRIAESRKPLLAIAAHDSPEWGAHHRVHRLQCVLERGAVIVVTVDELAQRTVRQGPGRQAISNDLAGRPQTVTGAQLVQQKGEAAQSRARPHAFAHAGEEPVSIEPEGIAPSIRKRDRYTKGRLRQIGVSPIEVLFKCWKRLVTRGLQFARREELLEGSLGRERLF